MRIRCFIGSVPARRGRTGMSFGSPLSVISLKRRRFESYCPPTRDDLKSQISDFTLAPISFAHRGSRTMIQLAYCASPSECAKVSHFSER